MLGGGGSSSAMPSGSQLLTLERMLFAADMPVAGASELVTIAG